MGYIGVDGKFIINPTYKYATSFSEGLAFVTPENGFPTCIDKKGEIKFVLKEATQVSSFKSGLASVKIKDKFGFIDNSGKIVINPQFDGISDFSDGLAAVGNKKDKDSEDLIWGYIDNSGKIIINPQFKSAGDFKEGKALVSDGKKYGYVDKKGLYAINPQFEDANEFSEGLAGIKQGESWGFINTEGKIVINPQFEAIASFKNGLAPVRSGKENWGYIDKEGKFAVNPQFKAAAKFYGEFAPVVSGDKIGLIDKQGKYIVNPQFTDIFTAYWSWSNNFSYWERYEGVSSDYFDVTEFGSNFFENSKDGNFRGLNIETTLRNLVDAPDNKKNLKENSKYSVINSEKKEITKDVNIESTIFYFQKPVYDMVSNYYYGYNTGSEKQYNFLAKLESIGYTLKLNTWGKANKKGKVLAEGLKAELIKLYNGSEKPNEQNSDSQTRSLDSLLTTNNSNDSKETLFVYAPKISFSIYYSASSVTLTARFRTQENM